MKFLKSFTLILFFLISMFFIVLSQIRTSEAEKSKAETEANLALEKLKVQEVIKEKDEVLRKLLECRSK